MRISVRHSNDHDGREEFRPYVDGQHAILLEDDSGGFRESWFGDWQTLARGLRRSLEWGSLTRQIDGRDGAADCFRPPLTISSSSCAHVTSNQDWYTYLPMGKMSWPLLSTRREGSSFSLKCLDYTIMGQRACLPAIWQQTRSDGMKNVCHFLQQRSCPASLLGPVAGTRRSDAGVRQRLVATVHPIPHDSHLYVRCQFRTFRHILR